MLGMLGCWACFVVCGWMVLRMFIMSSHVAPPPSTHMHHPHPPQKARVGFVGHGWFPHSSHMSWPCTVAQHPPRGAQCVSWATHQRDMHCQLVSAASGVCVCVCVFWGGGCTHEMGLGCMFGEKYMVVLAVVSVGSWVKAHSTTSVHPAWFVTHA